VLTGCWKELLIQTWIECQLVDTYFQIWILPMMSLYLPSYLNRPHTCTWDDDIKGRISRAWDELAEDKSPSFGLQLQSRSGGCNGWDFVYLGSLVRSTTESSPDVSCHNAITRMTVLNLDNQIWKSKSTISMSTKLKLYIILAFYQSSCMAHGSPEIYSRLMILINGVC